MGRFDWGKGWKKGLMMVMMDAVGSVVRRLKKRRLRFAKESCSLHSSRPNTDEAGLWRSGVE